MNTLLILFWISLPVVGAFLIGLALFNVWFGVVMAVMVALGLYSKKWNDL